MINNAGVMPLSTLDQLKVEEWDRMIDVNIKGVLYRIRTYLEDHYDREISLEKLS
jgi:NADP-dependent 3-hydroxy acid dehydrogenase YdfG